MLKLSFNFLLIIFFVNQSHGAVSVEKAESLFRIFSQAYSEELLMKNEQLIFNPPFPGSTMTNWDFDLVHASYNRENSNHYINVFGGLIKLEKLSLDGLALILCHELGHGLGKAPFKNNGFSTEGQSDYYATSECLGRIFLLFPQEEISSATNEMISFCKMDAMCIRGLAAVRDGFLVLNSKDQISEIDLLAVDTSVVANVNHENAYYPSLKCRLQTLRNGLVSMQRPACWYQD